VVYPGDESGFVAECQELAVVTQGATLDETVANLREAVALYLEGEDREALGLAPTPTVLISMELEPAHA
jgi:predicted RNase H-like HicB family nuclease